MSSYLKSILKLCLMSCYKEILLPIAEAYVKKTSFEYDDKFLKFLDEIIKEWLDKM